MCSDLWHSAAMPTSVAAHERHLGNGNVPGRRGRTKRRKVAVDAFSQPTLELALPAGSPSLERLPATTGTQGRRSDMRFGPSETALAVMAFHKAFDLPRAAL